MGILWGTRLFFWKNANTQSNKSNTANPKKQAKKYLISKINPILTSLTNNCWFIEKDKTSKMFDISKKLNSLSENPDFDGLDLGFSVGAAVQVQQRQAAKTKQHFENIQVHCF